MTTHHFSAGVYIREMTLKAQHTVETHMHIYDHFGLLGEGRVAVELDRHVEVFEGPCVIEIKAGKEHRITALTDVTWFCIHATSETDAENIDVVLIKGE